MAIPDNLIIHYYEILSEKTPEELSDISEKIKTDPMTEKKNLAFMIVETFDDKDNALQAQKYFEDTIQNNQVPVDIIEINKNSLEINQPISIKELLVKLQLTASNSDAKRLIGERAVEIDGKQISDPNEMIDINNVSLIRSGKRNWRKLI
jgi:tyrosyl-tRNA synthetase